jgi:hypothetical protein
MVVLDAHIADEEQEAPGADCARQLFCFAGTGVSRKILRRSHSSRFTCHGGASGTMTRTPTARRRCFGPISITNGSRARPSCGPMRYRTGPRRPTPRSSASRCCALGQLSPRDRAIIVLRYWEDHSIQTVSELLDLSPGVVKMQSMRALARLRVLLGEDEAVPPEPGTRDAIPPPPVARSRPRASVHADPLVGNGGETRRGVPGVWRCGGLRAGCCRR